MLNRGRPGEQGEAVLRREGGGDGVARERGEVGDQAVPTVYRQAVGGLPSGLFADRGGRALGFGDKAGAGVVQKLPFSGYTGVRKAPACEGRIAIGRVSCAGGCAPPRGQACWG